MNDMNIEILESENVVSKGDALLPLNFITVGEIEHDSVRVYIKQSVYKKIEKIAKTQMSKEVGSILIGDYVEESNKKTVVISACIEAKYTDASASTLTFTHETWDYVYKEKEKNYADKKIVGWQHTHPGYGIFLSNYDIFIQENFFNLPWQIAYVVDPIADTRGFFEWKKDSVEKMTGFYVYDDAGKRIAVDEEPAPPKKHVSFSTVVLVVLLMISVLTTIVFGVEKNVANEKLEEALSKSSTPIISVPAENTAGVVTNISENTETFIVYTVEKGDYLEKICKAHNIDYGKNIWKIKKINGISDVNKLYSGQKLYLPMP